MADESLRVVIEDTDSFETFKKRVFDVLQISDNRSQTHMLRLLEDTNLTAQLDYHELRKIKEAVKVLFPAETLPAKMDLGPATAFEFSKLMAMGEDLKLFIHNVESYEDLNRALKDVWDVLDARLARTNDRDIRFRKFVEKFPFELNMKMNTIFQLLYGKEIEGVGKVLKEIKDGEILRMKDEAERRQEEVEKNAQTA